MDHQRLNGNGAGRSEGFRTPRIRGDELRAYIDTFRNATSEKERRDAADRIILGNYGLAVFIARRYLDRGLTHEDLTHEGVLGMLRALKDFDPEKAEFSTYARWWIRSFMERATYDTGCVIRVPEKTREAAGRARKLAAASIAEHGRAPEDAELAAVVCGRDPGIRTSADVEKLERLKSAANPQYLWLDAPHGGTDGGNFHDLIGAEPEDVDGTDREKLRRLVADAFATLPARETKIIRERYGFDGEPQTFLQIASHMGMTWQRVQQLHNVALEKVRRFVSNGRKRKEVVEAMQP